MSIDRVLIPHNILDRVEELERQLAELKSGVVTVQVVQVPSGGSEAGLNGWLATGTAFQDVAGRIVLDASLPGITLAPGGIIKSQDYEAGLSGFKIDGGFAEFNDVTVRGTIYASAGEIAGWTIGQGHLYAGSGSARAGLRPADYPFYAGAEDPASAPFRVTVAGALTATDATITGAITATSGAIGGWAVGSSALTGGNATLHSSGYLSLGTGNDIARLDAADSTYRLWIGNATASSAPFRVTKTGALIATNATITGTITATAGAFTGTVTVGSASPYVQIDGANKWIQSSDFSSGVSGFRIDQYGNAEINNLIARGELRGGVFAKNLVEATAGSLLITKSAGVLSDDVIVPSSGTWYIYVKDPPGGGFLFAANDVCRLRAQTSSGVVEVWFTVASPTDMGDGRQRYTCTYQSGTRGVTYPAGSPVVDYGVSGNGGLLLTADAADAPRLTVFTHAGSPWNTMTERVRIGELNGWGPFSSSAFGWAVGDYSGNEYAYYAPSTGLVVRGTVRADDGFLNNLDVTGTLNVSTSGVIKSGATGYNSGTGWWLEYNAGTPRIFVGNSSGNKLLWDGSTLSITGTVTATGGSLGSLTIDGVLGIGSSGGIYQGTGTFSSPYTGLKIWNDGGIGRLATYRKGNTQIYIDTNGRLRAGAVKLDYSGVTITLGYGVESQLRWISGDAPVCYITADAIDNETVGMYIQAPWDAEGGYWKGKIILQALCGVTANSELILDPLSYSTPAVVIDGDLGCDIRVSGDAYYTGSIKQSTALGCRVIRTTSQSIPNSTLTALSFDTEIHDTDGCWSSGTPTRLTASTSGYYEAGGSVNIVSSSGSFHLWIGIRKNGTTWLANNSTWADAAESPNAWVGVSTGMFWMDAGDYVEVVIYQTSGGSRNTRAASSENQHECCGWLVRVA